MANKPNSDSDSDSDGHGRRNLPKLASVKQAWEEIATAVTNQVHIHRDL